MLSPLPHSISKINIQNSTIKFGLERHLFSHLLGITRLVIRNLHSHVGVSLRVAVGILMLKFEFFWLKFDFSTVRLIFILFVWLLVTRATVHVGFAQNWVSGIFQRN